MVKNWLGRKGLQVLEMLMNEEKTTCNTLEGLFETLSNKIRPQFNEMINSLQFQKLYRKDGEMQKSGWGGCNLQQ